MIGFLLSPIGRYVVMAGVALALIFVAVKVIEQRGAERLQSKIDRANKAAGDAADKAEAGVLTCPPGMWDRERRTCATKLH
jgi:hypothetical protein